jgi:hypothetical protein
MNQHGEASGIFRIFDTTLPGFVIVRLIGCVSTIVVGYGCPGRGKLPPVLILFFFFLIV